MCIDFRYIIEWLKGCMLKAYNNLIELKVDSPRGKNTATCFYCKASEVIDKDKDATVDSVVHTKNCVLNSNVKHLKRYFK